MYNNNIVNFQESATILNAGKKSLQTYWRHHVNIRYVIYKHILYRTFLTSLRFFFGTQLNGFTYFCLIQIILFTINHLFAHS